MLITSWLHSKKIKSVLSTHDQKHGTRTQSHSASPHPKGYLHCERSGLGRVSVLLGDHFFTWQVEPHLPSSCCGGWVDCGGGNRRSTVGLHHGEEFAGPLLFWAWYLGWSSGGRGAELHSCGVLQRVFTGLYFKRCPASKPTVSS